MAESKREQRRERSVDRLWRMCHSKRPYPTAEAARRVGGEGVVGLRPYHCPHCRQWHLGHTSADLEARPVEP